MPHRFEMDQVLQVQYSGVAHNRYLDPRGMKVTKVGKKWVTIESPAGKADRFCILDDDDHDGRRDAANDGPYPLDGGDYSSPGRVWRDAAHHTAYVEKKTAWTRLTAHARERSTMPAHLTTADLERIADQLTPPEGEDHV